MSFSEIRFGQGIQLNSGNTASREVILVWEAESGTGYVVEMSSDFNSWQSVPSVAQAQGGNTWVSNVVVDDTKACFFRIRWVGTADK